MIALDDTKPRAQATSLLTKLIDFWSGMVWIGEALLSSLQYFPAWFRENSPQIVPVVVGFIFTAFVGWSLWLLVPVGIAVLVAVDTVLLNFRPCSEDRMDTGKMLLAISVMFLLGEIIGLLWLFVSWLVRVIT